MPGVLLWLGVDSVLQNEDAQLLGEIGTLPEYLRLEVVGEPVVLHATEWSAASDKRSQIQRG
jgi:hypothetical protein